MIRYIIITISFLILFFTGCSEPTLLLEIRTINNNRPLSSDLADWGRIWDENWQTWVFAPKVNPDIVPVELALVATGGWSRKTFSAAITEYEISFTHIYPDTNPKPTYEKVKGAVNFYLSTTDKNPTEAYIILCPAVWKQRHFATDSFAIVQATITLRGKETQDNTSLITTGSLTISFGDWPDDPYVYGE